MFKYVANATTQTLDYGGIISVRLNFPTGYAFHAFHSFSVNDWTVVLQNMNVQSTYVDVTCAKLVAGSNSITLSACIACIRKEYVH